jgi:hypothetical protein
MRNSTWRNYLTNPHEFDGWVKANAVVGSMLAIGMVVMALAGLYFAGPHDGMTVFSMSLRPSEGACGTGRFNSSPCPVMHSRPHGYEPAGEAAMAPIAKSWRRD